jgi:hypothetical protein
VADICQNAGISPATYLRLEEALRGMQPPDMQHLKRPRLELDHCDMPDLCAVWPAVADRIVRAVSEC